MSRRRQRHRSPSRQGGGCALAKATYGGTNGSIDLALIGFDGARPVMRVRRQFPGAAAVLPFWSTSGDIGCLTFNEAGSNILSFPMQAGNAEVLHHSDAHEEEIAPAWSTTGKYVRSSCRQSERTNAGGLVLPRLRPAREVIPAAEAGRGARTVVVRRGNIVHPGRRHGGGLVATYLAPADAGGEDFEGSEELLEHFAGCRSG